MTHPVTKDEIVRSVRAERRATLNLLRPLDPVQFDTPTALPGWRVREVAAHLITVDRASVTGANLIVAFSSVERLERWNEKQVPAWAARPVTDLLVGLDRWGRRFARFAGLFPAAMYRVPVPNPFGRTLGMMVWVRAYDEWVHRQDIRRALGLGDEDVDVASVGEFLLASIGATIVPRSKGRTGTIEVSLQGAPVDAWTYDLAPGAGRQGEDRSADARIAAPAQSFIMAAAGRDPFDRLADEGRMKIEGDERLGRAFLAEVRVV